jgi:thiol-disulfide isomerase/thioredoxin
VLIRALTVLLVLCGAALAVLVFGPARHEKPPVEAVGIAPAQTLGQFIALDQKLPAPALAFTTRDGTTKELADFRGQLLLVNLWATWCVPCVEEMPALDRLQAKLGKALTILAIAEDRRGADIVDPFLARTGIKNLAVELDPKAAASNAFGVEGLPTSFLIDGDGMIIGKLEGAARWDEPAMVAVLQPYLERK